jgi:acetyltransferase-like isoleucine patch superfamily enzyme
MNIVNKVFFKLRQIFFNCYFNTNAIIHGWPTLDNKKHITLGNNVQFNSGVTILAAQKVSIGNNVVLSLDCKIMDTGLDTNKLANSTHEHVNSAVIIEEFVWIGAGAIVLPGVTIGKYSVIAAGSVVVKNIPPYSMAAGNPAEAKYKIDAHQRESQVNLA